MIRIILDEQDGVWTLDIMDTRNGSKFNVKPHIYYQDAAREIVEAMAKWNSSKMVKK